MSWYANQILTFEEQKGVRVLGKVFFKEDEQAAGSLIKCDNCISEQSAW